MTGKELKKVRIALELTQVELARLLGVEQPSVSDWEGGRHEPPHIVERFIRFYSRAPRWLRQELLR